MHSFSLARRLSCARWKTAALNDGSGLDRQELERLNALMDKRVENLSAQLAKLEQSNQVRAIQHIGSAPPAPLTTSSEPLGEKASTYLSHSLVLSVLLTHCVAT